jgi:hypothetical protein
MSHRSSKKTNTLFAVNGECSIQWRTRYTEFKLKNHIFGEELRPTKSLNTVQEFMALTKLSTRRCGQIRKSLLKADKMSFTKRMIDQTLWMKNFLARSYLLVRCK